MTGGRDRGQSRCWSAWTQPGAWISSQYFEESASRERAVSSG